MEEWGDLFGIQSRMEEGELDRQSITRGETGRMCRTRRIDLRRTFAGRVGRLLWIPWRDLDYEPGGALGSIDTVWTTISLNIHGRRNFRIKGRNLCLMEFGVVLPQSLGCLQGERTIWKHLTPHDEKEGYLRTDWFCWGDSDGLPWNIIINTSLSVDLNLLFGQTLGEKDSSVTIWTSLRIGWR